MNTREQYEAGKRFSALDHAASVLSQEELQACTDLITANLKKLATHAKHVAPKMLVDAAEGLETLVAAVYQANLNPDAFDSTGDQGSLVIAEEALTAAAFQLRDRMPEPLTQDELDEDQKSIDDSWKRERDAILATVQE